MFYSVNYAFMLIFLNDVTLRVMMIVLTQMSKSKGNVVDPFDRLEKYSTDGLRYYLLKDGVPHSDGSKNH